MHRGWTAAAMAADVGKTVRSTWTQTKWEGDDGSVWFGKGGSGEANGEANGRRPPTVR